MTDPIVSNVIDKFRDRSKAGIKEHGADMTRTDISRLGWLHQAQQEAMDFAVYLERLILEEEQQRTAMHLLGSARNYLEGLELADDIDAFFEALDEPPSTGEPE